MTNLRETGFSEQELAQAIEIALTDPDEIDLTVTDVETFEQAGLLTRNAGVVITLNNGQEFQLTIVRSK